jgi:hypothetical protein
LCGTVNNHIWGSENPQDFAEHEHDSPQINVWWALMKNTVMPPPQKNIFFKKHGDW